MLHKTPRGVTDCSEGDKVATVGIARELHARKSVLTTFDQGGIAIMAELSVNSCCPMGSSRRILPIVSSGGNGGAMNASCECWR